MESLEPIRSFRCDLRKDEREVRMKYPPVRVAATGETNNPTCCQSVGFLLRQRELACLTLRRAVEVCNLCPRLLSLLWEPSDRTSVRCRPLLGWEGNRRPSTTSPHTASPQVWAVTQPKTDSRIHKYYGGSSAISCYSWLCGCLRCKTCTMHVSKTNCSARQELTDGIRILACIKQQI